MSSPNSTFTELVSTTFRKHRKEIQDNLSNRNALLKYINDTDGKVMEDGGLSIVTPLDYNSNNTYQRYSDWDTLNISQSDVISAAEYQWRQIAINVVASGRELRINSGDSAIIKLAKARMKNAMRTFNNNFSNDLYSAGTLTNQINGLQALIADAGTGTVGGIDSAAFPFWQNQVFSGTTLSVTPSATTIEGSLMLPAWLATDRGPDDQVGLIVADNTFYSYFEASQVSLKRYNDTSKGNAGFTTLKYKNADVIYDGVSGIPSSHMYGCNMNYLNLVVHSQADMEVLDEVRPVNQDGSVTCILWMGNLTISNRHLQFVITA
jgi:hypothetical protein